MPVRLIGFFSRPGGSTLLFPISVPMVPLADAGGEDVGVSTAVDGVGSTWRTCEELMCPRSMSYGHVATSWQRRLLLVGPSVEADLGLPVIVTVR